MADVAADYLRRRRLAIMLAVTSVVCLLVGSFFDLYLETFFAPRLAIDDGKVELIHVAAEIGEEEPYSYVRTLDADLRVESSQQLRGICLGKVGDQFVFERRLSSLEGPGTDVKVNWKEEDVHWQIADAIAGGSGTAWCFLVKEKDRSVYALRFPDENPLRVAFGDKEIRSIEAYRTEDGAPAVAWLEKDTYRVRTAVHRDGKFQEGETFELGRAHYFVPLVLPGRTVLLYHHRSDQEFGSLIFRVMCCKACGDPWTGRTIRLHDPVWVGRSITGIDAARTINGTVVVITRSTSIQVARLDADLKPESDVHSLSLQTVVQKVAGYLWPTVMMFFSFSLVFLGFILLRDRRRFILERLRPMIVTTGRHSADIMQRAMAHILDLAILFPVWRLIIDLSAWLPEEFSITDPGFRIAVGYWILLIFLYGFLQEAIWGQTLGKRFIGIKVAGPDGKRAPFGGVLIRNLIRVLDANLGLIAVGMATFQETTFGLLLIAFPLAGILSLLLTSRRQRLGDLAGRTFVIDLTVPEGAADEKINAILKGMANPFKKENKDEE